MLTDAECQRPNVTGKREKRADGRGLRLVVTPTGGRTWELAYRFEGLARTLPLGAYPTVSIEEARRLVAEAKATISRREDPGARTLRATRQQAARDRARRFDAVAEEWFKRTVETRRDPRYAARVWARVKADLLPSLGALDVGEITSADVLRALQAVEARGAVYSAKTIGRYASSVFRYARIAHGVRDNPAEGIGDALLPTPAKVGQPSLPPTGVARFWAAFDRPHEDEELTRLALQLVMLTALRSNELRGARWSEIRGTEWHVPAERMKMKRPHAVPLSLQAAALVERLRELTGSGPLMFPGRRPGHSISENTVLFAIYGLGFKGEASVHGWRATFSTWAHATGRWPSEWIEACLAHLDTNAVRAAYNRQDWLPQRREIMQAWADWLDVQRGVGELLG